MKLTYAVKSKSFRITATAKECARYHNVTVVVRKRVADLLRLSPEDTVICDWQEWIDESGGVGQSWEIASRRTYRKSKRKLL